MTYAKQYFIPTEETPKQAHALAYFELCRTLELFHQYIANTDVPTKDLKRLTANVASLIRPTAKATA